MKMKSRNIKTKKIECDGLMKMTLTKIQKAPRSDDLMKRTSKIVKISKFAKILIDALVVIFGIYGVDFPP